MSDWQSEDIERAEDLLKLSERMSASTDAEINRVLLRSIAWSLLDIAKSLDIVQKHS